MAHGTLHDLGDVVTSDREIDRWHDDGGRPLSEDEQEAEDYRESVARLREWIRERFQSDLDFLLAADYSRGEVASRDLAVGCHHTTAWRRLQREFVRIQVEVRSNPELQASMPLPWRKWYFPKV